MKESYRKGVASHPGPQRVRNGEHPVDSAQSETPRMHGNSACGNRETPSTPIVQVAAGRLEKAMSQKANTHVGGGRTVA
jgi:hypothetical protein